MHISDRDRCNWFRERLETPLPRAYSKRRKLIILDRLAWADSFENFLSNKYSAAKRFGLEGAETLIPGMKELIDRAADGGVESIVLGMPHRGRLNVLVRARKTPRICPLCRSVLTPGLCSFRVAPRPNGSPRATRFPLPNSHAN